MTYTSDYENSTVNGYATAIRFCMDKGDIKGASLICQEVNKFILGKAELKIFHNVGGYTEEKPGLILIKDCRRKHNVYSQVPMLTLYVEEYAVYANDYNNNEWVSGKSKSGLNIHPEMDGFTSRVWSEEFNGFITSTYIASAGKRIRGKNPCVLDEPNLLAALPAAYWQQQLKGSVFFVNVGEDPDELKDLTCIAAPTGTRYSEVELRTDYYGKVNLVDLAKEPEDFSTKKTDQYTSETANRLKEILIADSALMEAKYPHTCPRCGSAAYVGFSSVDCSFCK